MMLIVFVTENSAGVSATDDDEDKKTNDVNGGTMTSEYRRQKKVIYEVIV